MPQTRSFKFVNGELNRRFLALVKKAGIRCLIDDGGAVHYAPADVEVVENELICPIRDAVFSSWQILHCPKNWANRYKDHMIRQDVPFVEELIDGQLCFLIPRKYRPHAWKLDNQGSKAEDTPAFSKW
jgi:hypothetical protein